MTRDSFHQRLCMGGLRLAHDHDLFVLGLAVLTVAVGIRNVHQSSRSAGVGFGLLLIGRLFVCLAGVFKGFPLHNVAGAVGIPSLVMAVLLLSSNFRHATDGR